MLFDKLDTVVFTDIDGFKLDINEVSVITKKEKGKNSFVIDKRNFFIKEIVLTKTDKNEIDLRINLINAANKFFYFLKYGFSDKGKSFLLFHFSDEKDAEVTLKRITILKSKKAKEDLNEVVETIKEKLK